MSANHHSQLIEYLHTELAIPAASIELALRQQSQTNSHPHMILWQYGLITLDQLNRIFDWLERTSLELSP